MTEDQAASIAETDAETAIDYARQGGEEPIVWITGNSYMPPLRGFGRAEEVWQASHGTEDGYLIWDAYWETFEQELDKANVYLGYPDYDNALYVVDMDRWQYVDGNEDAETLQEEWEKKSDD